VGAYWVPIQEEAIDEGPYNFITRFLSQAAEDFLPVCFIFFADRQLCLLVEVIGTLVFGRDFACLLDLLDELSEFRPVYSSRSAVPVLDLVDGMIRNGFVRLRRK
jgi:hypothetical protein